MESYVVQIIKWFKWYGYERYKMYMEHNMGDLNAIILHFRAGVQSETE